MHLLKSISTAPFIVLSLTGLSLTQPSSKQKDISILRLKLFDASKLEATQMSIHGE